MKIAVLTGQDFYLENPAVKSMISRLEKAGNETVAVSRDADLDGSDVQMLASIGGDGTFLSAASAACRGGIPVVGVNLGRMGFLSENSPEDVASAILNGSYTIEDCSLLTAFTPLGTCTALNEITVSRSGSAMLGIKVSVCGKSLPVYWADGLLIATPSGSTAYSLSVGGPIVLPSSQVIIIEPIAPHNLNVRPLVVPQDSDVTLEFLSRDDEVKFSCDNNAFAIPASSRIEVRLAQFSLKKVCLANSNFIKALSDKLHWGDDIRNI